MSAGLQHDNIPAKTQVQPESVSVVRGDSLVKPKKSIPRVQSWPSRVMEDPAANSTVLLRQPMPKYSFQTVKKSAPQKEQKSKKTLNPNSGSTLLSTSQSCCTLDSLSVSEQTEDRSVQAKSPIFDSNNISNQTIKPVNKVGPVQNGANSLSACSVTKHNLAIDSTHRNGPSVTTGEAEQLFQSIISTLSGPPAVHVCECSQEMDKLKKEINSLKCQLDVQLQVNSELKKLLVASVGADLQNRVEKLARDKAELSMELGDYSKKVTEDYEHLDKIAIQADMWRSKFLASRVMVDELASGKAFYAMQFQDSQHALQQLLNERHELRANLFESCRCLQQVRWAFDPLNSNGSCKVRSSNVIDLAKTNQQLAESIKYRLLPSHVTLHATVNMESEVDSEMTKGEAFAEQLLSRQVKPEDFRRHVTSSVAAPAPMTVERYHPSTRHGDLTMNCCVHCQGEIHAL